MDRPSRGFEMVGPVVRLVLIRRPTVSVRSKMALRWDVFDNQTESNQPLIEGESKKKTYEKYFVDVAISAWPLVPGFCSNTGERL